MMALEMWQNLRDSGEIIEHSYHPVSVKLVSLSMRFAREIRDLLHPNFNSITDLFARRLLLVRKCSLNTTLLVWKTSWNL